MEVGERLRNRREELNYTQDYVVERLGISRQTLSNWENGRTYPDIERIIRLSDIYQLSLDELLKGDAKMVSKLQKDTQTNQFGKKILIGLLLNIFLMVLLVIRQPSQVTIFSLFLLIALNSLNIFYLIVRKI